MKQYTGYGRRSQTTPQTEPIPGTNQQLNNTGVGYSFVVDDMTRLRRFLILSTSGGTFYCGERKLTRDNLDVVERLLRIGRGVEVVQTIKDISEAGRAPSNDPALFALARCCACDVHGKVSYLRPERIHELHRAHHPTVFEHFPEEGKTQRLWSGTAIRQGDTITLTEPAATQAVQIDHPDDIAVRRAAYAALPNVARTGTHLLHFLEYVKQFRGRGPLHDRSIEAWYQDKEASRLAYQLVKYQSRDGWSQRDVLRLARPKPQESGHNALYHWTTKGWDATPESIPSEEALGLIWAFERAKKTSEPNEIADLIVKYRLPREAVPTESLKSVKVWEALLQDMPLEAMTRNLATMTRHGVLVPMGAMTASVVERLRSQEAIHRARLHPIKLLAALTTYASGKSVRGDATWTPLREIVDALNDAFYLSFANVVPTGKRILLAVDVSGSMHGTLVNGIPGLQCHTGAGGLALVIARSEQQYHLIGFDTRAYPLTLSPRQRLDDVVSALANAGGGGTDCAIPFAYAMQAHLDVDAVITLSDSESWYGKAHPSQALNQYRQQVGHPVRAINVQMTATHVSNTDPGDWNSMEAIGFDTSVPEITASFIRGDL